MVSHKIFASGGLLTFVALHALFYLSNAQNSPQDFLNAHNDARTAVGVPDVSWDTTLEAYAQDYANQLAGDCSLVHSGGPYGENLYSGSDINSYTGVDAVDYWVKEGPNYDYNLNSCAVGMVCGHYTQVVWRTTTRVGCARVGCNNGGVVVVCSYDPQGNIGKERPY